MEHEPCMRIDFGDEVEFEAVPENTSLFRFMGHLAMYNHAFFAKSETGGVYLFAAHPGYAEVEEYMLENDYPIHDKLRGVAQCDMDAYDNMVKSCLTDIEAGVPEDWS